MQLSKFCMMHGWSEAQPRCYGFHSAKRLTIQILFGQQENKMYHYYNITIMSIPFYRTPLTRTRNWFADIHFLRLVKHSLEREWLLFFSWIIAFQSYNITIGVFCILSVRGANLITGLHLFTIFLLMRMHIEMGIESRKSDSRRLPVCYYLPNEYSTYCAN